MQGQSIAGLPSGIRATAFDPSRDCLWIFSRYFREAGVPLLTLTRFNITDRSAVSTPIPSSADGFIRASVAVDLKGDVWMAWGRTLARYDPTANSTRFNALPAMSGVTVSPEDPSLDGNSVAIAIADDSAVWLVANSVRGVFRFDPSTDTWSKAVGLPLAPTTLTRIAFAKPGSLIVNGVTDGTTPGLAIVDTVLGTAYLLPAHARDFAVVSSNVAVYVDERGAFVSLDLSTRNSSQVAATAPVSGVPDLAEDGYGNIWFSMTAYRSVGIGRITAGSDAIAVYPFPRGSSPATSGPVLSCPAPPCDAPLGMFDPQLQSIVADSSNNIWITSGVPGLHGDPALTTSAAPLYELPAGA